MLLLNVNAINVPIVLIMVIIAAIALLTRNITKRILSSPSSRLSKQKTSENANVRMEVSHGEQCNLVSEINNFFAPT